MFTLTTCYYVEPRNESKSTNQAADQAALKQTYETLINIIQLSLKKNTDILNSDFEFKDQNCFFLSGNEQLARLALSKNPSGCFLVQRNIEGKFVLFIFSCYLMIDPLYSIVASVEQDFELRNFKKILFVYNFLLVRSNDSIFCVECVELNT